MYLLLSTIRLSTKIIFSERSSYLIYSIESFAKIQRQLYRFSNRIICNSYSQRDWLVDSAKIRKDNISVIYNGYELSELSEKNFLKIIIIS